MDTRTVPGRLRLMDILVKDTGLTIVELKTDPEHAEGQVSGALP